ncbi:sulfotransferase ssu-1-like [Argiope bruennichi]|uniref:sulfotransferase ssu-1-like n=1 Tax=Argiope bruennichi TaxID=94029 RepID=UPI002494CAA5|nr:sulfotransferase ssu-1-like [Argiope bruennichi]XP_055924315.1 sulfotransferase ssu-1-like [Argiope bruennichi]
MTEILKRPRYAKMNSLLYPEMFSPNCFKEALLYKPKFGDLFISTYPKCGTTWIQNIILHIFRKGQKLSNPSEFLRLAPYIDMQGQEGIDKMPRPGAFKTHIPFSRMPYSKDAKYIFVARNPKDCCVSSYYHTRNQPGFEYWDSDFNDFFELFIAGEVQYNDYFDHLLDWYPHRNDPNVFYTTYEHMKMDIQSVIIRLSRFLGKEYIDAIEKDNNVLNNIKFYTNFNYMKENLSNIYLIKKGSDLENMYEGLRYRSDFVASLNTTQNLPGLQFMRKGIVGDWKNHFSSKQTKRMNRKILLHLKDTEFLQWNQDE